MDWKWNRNDWYNEAGEPLSSWTEERWNKLTLDEQKGVLLFHLGQHFDLSKLLRPDGRYFCPYDFKNIK